MKIVCDRCKVLLGEQEPLLDSSEISAKCVSCLKFEKEQAERKEKQRMFPGKEIVLDGGLKGVLSIAGKDTQKLSLWELEVAGKKFYCGKDTREEFIKFLAKITDTDVEIMYMHSLHCKVSDSWMNKKRKKKSDPKPIEEALTESIDYNCTVKISKQYVQSVFDDVADRFDKVATLMADMIINQYTRNQQDKSCEI